MLSHLMEGLAFASAQTVCLQLSSVDQDGIAFKPQLLQQIKLSCMCVCVCACIRKQLPNNQSLISKYLATAKGW